MNGLLLVEDKAKLKLYWVNEATGEVVHRANESDLKWWRCDPREEPYWSKLYWVHYGLAADSFTGKAQAYFHLMSFVEPGGRLVLSEEVERGVMERCGISRRTFMNYLQQFSRDGLIFKMKGTWRGTYWVNPFMYGNGRWDACRSKQKSFKEARYVISDLASGSAGTDPAGGIGGDSPDDLLPVEPCEGQA